jgi:hypothetical protein
LYRWHFSFSDLKPSRHIKVKNRRRWIYGRMQSYVQVADVPKAPALQGREKMYNRVMDESETIAENMERRGYQWDGMNFVHVDPLGLAPFSKEIEQVPHREMSAEEALDQRERDLRFESGEF